MLRNSTFKHGVCRRHRKKGANSPRSPLHYFDKKCAPKSLHLEGIFQIFFTSEGAHPPQTPSFENTICVKVTSNKYKTIFKGKERRNEQVHYFDMCTKIAPFGGYISNFLHSPFRKHYQSNGQQIQNYLKRKGKKWTSIILMKNVHEIAPFGEYISNFLHVWGATLRLPLSKAVSKLVGPD